MPWEKQDKERLSRIIDFLQSELEDLRNKFLKLDFSHYSSDNDIRRNVERCIENIVNASLDAAKIIFVNEKLLIPDTYREYFIGLYTHSLIDKDTADILAEGVRLRNILAHQYLDIRWQKLERFLASDWKVYQSYINFIKGYLA